MQSCTLQCPTLAHHGLEVLTCIVLMLLWSQNVETLSEARSTAARCGSHGVCIGVYT